MILVDANERHAPQFRVLSDVQCQEIYAAALECLERVGIQMHNPAARDLLAAHGARVDGSLVYIPAELVKQAVAAAPHEYTVWGRDGTHEMRVARVHRLGARWNTRDARGAWPGAFWSRPNLYLFH